MVPLLLLLLSILSTEATVGVPVEVDYLLPEGWMAESMESTDQWEVISQDSGLVSIVPLDLDTLALPSLSAWNTSGDTVLLPPPRLIVTRTMPDTLYAVSVFPYPAPLDIPPGFPRDYLEQMRFWLVWGGPPEFDWLLILIAAGAVIVLVVLALLMARRRRLRAVSDDSDQPPQPPEKRSAEALALLESAWFTEGRWQELYTAVDRLLRNTIAWKFGVDNRALTYGQVRRHLHEEPDGRAFIEESESLVEEITLQRYAGWGSSRDRAQRFVRLLAKIMETWA